MFGRFSGVRLMAAGKAEAKRERRRERNLDHRARTAEGVRRSRGNAEREGRFPGGCTTERGWIEGRSWPTYFLAGAW